MRAIIYVRQSQDRTGEELGVTRQIEDARKLAQLRNWTVVAEHQDNDTSAAGKRNRPGFEAVLAGVEAGQAEAVIAWDMTRLTRNRRDTVRLLEAGERKGVHLAFVRGSDLDLSTPAGRLTADILAGVARHEIDQKSDRQKRAVVQAAEAGRRVGGRRPFGYLADGVTLDPDESEALGRAYEAVLAGVTVGRVARDLNEAGFHTPQPKRDGSPSPWTAQTLGPTMRNPRYAGLRGVHRRPEHGRGTWEIVGPAVWPGVVAEETWRAVDAMLGAPERRRPSRDGVGLLTGVARCGVCGDTIHRGAAPRGGAKTYRCRGSLGHFARRSDPVDEYVEAMMIEWLSRPGAREMVYDHDRPDVAGLRTEMSAVERRLDELEADYAVGAIDRRRLEAGRQRGRARLREIEAKLADTRRFDVLGDILDAPDVGAAWAALDPPGSADRRRAIIAAVARVVVHPVGRGVRKFDPSTVEVIWQETS